MDTLTLVIVIGGVAIIVLLIVGVIVSARSERSLVEQRLGQYLEGDQAAAGRQDDRAALTDWVSKRVEKTSYGNHIARELARADLKFKVGEYIGLIFIATVVGGGLAWFLGNRHPISFLIGAVV